MHANKPAQALAAASETDPVDLAHFLAKDPDSAEHAHDGARVRNHVAAFDRFAAPKAGERF